MLNRRDMLKSVAAFAALLATGQAQALPVKAVATAKPCRAGKVVNEGDLREFTFGQNRQEIRNAQGDVACVVIFDPWFEAVFRAEGKPPALGQVIQVEAGGNQFTGVAIDVGGRYNGETGEMENRVKCQVFNAIE